MWIGIVLLGQLVMAGSLFEGSLPVKGTNKLFSSIHDRPSARGHRALVLFNALSKDVPCRICQYYGKNSNYTLYRPMQDYFELISESVKNKKTLNLAFIHMDLATTRDSFVKVQSSVISLCS